MRLNPLLVTAFLLGIVSLQSARAQNHIRVASWNLELLTSQPWVELHKGVGVKRSLSDFSEYKAIARRLAPDVLVMQELGGADVPENIFGTNEWRYFVSTNGNRQPRGVVPGLYVGIGIAKRSGLEVLEAEEITSMSGMAEDGSVIRSGLAVRLASQGQRLTVVAIHLRAGCEDNISVDKSRTVDCKALWTQVSALNKWIKMELNRVPIVLVAGDFNRYLQKKRRNGADQILDKLTADISTSSATLFPQWSKTDCPTRQRANNEPIDFFLLFSRQPETGLSTYQEYTYDPAALHDGIRLSNHCPILATLNIPLTRR